MLRSREDLRGGSAIIHRIISRRRRRQLLPRHLRPPGAALQPRQQQHPPLPRPRIPLSSQPPRQCLQLARLAEHGRTSDGTVHGGAVHDTPVLPIAIHPSPHGIGWAHGIVRIAALPTGDAAGVLLVPVPGGDLRDEDRRERGGLCADAFRGPFPEGAGGGGLQAGVGERADVLCAHFRPLRAQLLLPVRRCVRGCGGGGARCGANQPE